jgi:hypothetical protein
LNDDDKSGSGAGAGAAGVPPAGDGAGKDVTKNKTVKMTMDSVMAANADLVAKNKEKDLIIGDLTRQLSEANDILEGQEKARLISEIMPRSSFKLDELNAKTPEELKSIRATLDFAMPPKANSVRFGVSAADLSDREKGLTVGDLSFSTAKKRKALAGVA